MIKRLLFIAVAAAFAMSASAELNVTFNNNDNEGWGFDGNATIENGHAFVDMPGGNGSKYRQDIKYNGSALTIDPATDKVFAFKFIGDMPMANYTLELGDGTTNIKKANFRRNTNTANTLSTIGGNYVLYVDLSGDAEYTALEAFNPKLLQLKVADVASDAEVHTYTIDWIKTYSSLDELKAGMNVADDPNDQDEVNAPVLNVTTGTPYGDIVDAVNNASNGDEIVIKEDQTIGSRFGIGKAVTISGATGNEVIRSSFNDNLIFLISNTKIGEITFKDLAITGNGKDTSKAIAEINNGGNIVTFENVTFKDMTFSGSEALALKNGGKSVLKNVTFENINLPEGKSMVFLGANCQATLCGELKNVSVFLEKDNSKIYVDEAGVTGDVIPVTIGAARQAGAVVVYGTTNVDMFSLTNADFHLEADEANNNLVLAEGTLGIEDFEIENAPAEYFNLQGVKVAEPTPGLYIMRQGSKTTKVVIR